MRDFDSASRGRQMGWLCGAAGRETNSGESLFLLLKRDLDLNQCKEKRHLCVQQADSWRATPIHC